MCDLPSRLIALRGFEAGSVQSFGNLQTPWNEGVGAVIRKGASILANYRGSSGFQVRRSMLSVASARYVLWDHAPERMHRNLFRSMGGK